MKNNKKLAVSALFLALGLLLPFLTGQIQSIGSMLLPMHIPVLLCGFICGWQYGAIVGFCTPLLRSILFGMPMMFPMAVCMAVELSVSGLVTGMMYKRWKGKLSGIYVSLLTAMLAGRMAWGITCMIVYPLLGMDFGWKIFMSGALLNAIPGIIVQLILIPTLVQASEKVQLVNQWVTE